MKGNHHPSLPARRKTASCYLDTASVYISKQEGSARRNWQRDNSLNTTRIFSRLCDTQVSHQGHLHRQEMPLQYDFSIQKQMGSGLVREMKIHSVTVASGTGCTTSARTAAWMSTNVHLSPCLRTPGWAALSPWARVVGP